MKDIIFLNSLSQSKFYFLNEQDSKNALLANCIRNLGKKYDSYLSSSLVLVNIYANMIIGIIKEILFLEFFFSIKTL